MTTMPFNRPHAGYTHATWRSEMAVAATAVAGIRRDLDVMAASLAEVQAGRTQQDLVGGCQVAAVEVLRATVQLIEDTDDRYLPVWEAIRKAGGRPEVADDKHYHQRT